jgi:hypothetical protein
VSEHTLGITSVLHRIGWSARTMGERTGFARRTAQRIVEGKRECPPYVIAWLERVAAWLDEHPCPQAPAPVTSLAEQRSGTKDTA